MVVGKWGGNKLEQWIEAIIPQPVKEIMHILERAGHEIWLVGGCVRDLYLGREPEDYDLATDALPETTAALFARTVMTGARHGTVTVIHKEMSVEITTFRSESAYSDSRRPDAVFFHRDIRQDLARRDFTVNSMAWNKKAGLMDPFAGLADLRAGILRCVGAADERFQEDTLRILRAVRFSVQLDLQPETGLLEAAARNNIGIKNISRERIWREMRLILTSPYSRQISSYAGQGVFAVSMEILLGTSRPDELLAATMEQIIAPDWPQNILPALLWLISCAADAASAGWMQNLRFVKTGSNTKQLMTVFMKKCRISRSQAAVSAAALYWCSLRLVLTRVRSLYQLRITLRLLARRFRLEAGDAISIALSAANMLSEFCRRTGVSDIGLEQDIASMREMSQPAITVSQLQITGKELQEEGIKAGREMRLTLDRLLSQVIKYPASNEADILRRLLPR